MRRIDRMSKDKILDIFIGVGECPKCILHRKDNHDACSIDNGKGCIEKIVNYLEGEMPMIPRCHNCNTAEEFIKMYEESLNGRKTNYFVVEEIAEYMMEKVPAEKNWDEDIMIEVYGKWKAKY